MLELSNVTLVAITSVRMDEHIAALKYSMKDIKFGEVKLLIGGYYNYSPEVYFDLVNNNISIESVPSMKNIDEWNKAVIYELPKHIKTDYCILIHDNGFIVDASKWNPEWLNYDYIGAPWPLPQAGDNVSYRDINRNIIRVGNSVSLRSKKLLELPTREFLDLPWQAFHGWTNEDGFICVNNRHYYEMRKCKFAPLEVAVHFSKENEISENKGIDTFCFHNYNGSNAKYKNLLK